MTEQEKRVLANIVRKQVGGCEVCKKDRPLQPHRIKRGYRGGDYVPRNIMMICSECHKIIHRTEGLRWKKK